ncbi:MAG: hypothetical protein ACO23V_11970, partial [Chitinophagaceae bacterium]
LRGVWGNPWEFESPYLHHIENIGLMQLYQTFFLRYKEPFLYIIIFIESKKHTFFLDFRDFSIISTLLHFRIHD